MLLKADAALAAQYRTRYKLDASLFHTDLEETLRSQKPDAVLVYTTIQDHRRVIVAAAKHGIASMVEKPLSTTMQDALAIRAASRQYHVPVLVNYETTWYSSNAEAATLRRASAMWLATHPIPWRHLCVDCSSLSQCHCCPPG